MPKRWVLAAAFSAALVPGASAQLNHDAMSCDELWFYRNSIYKNAGYCFKTTRAIRAFGNAGCQFDEMELVPLSSADRREVSAVQQAERRKRCPR